MADIPPTQSSQTTRPKLGLALSGGGFRASLFHIGVLARLAELKVLPRVEVLSTVSGGSIVGAYYYLKAKELLEGRRNDYPKKAISPALQAYFDQAYVTIVREIENEFLSAVQKNLRTRMLWNPFKNARMFLSDDYSRSDRMAELYNEHLYLPLWKKITGQSDASNIYLREIAINPVPQLHPASAAGASFNVQTYNQDAACKIPILTINATTLNTGHPWHFTGAWAGEPAAKKPITQTIDTNVTLEQLRFDGQDRYQPGQRPALTDSGREKKRKEKLDDLSLADAVAASACVPGIFYPMSIHDLYWNSAGEEIVVELIDGGIYDNQGMDALYDAQCTEIICSDASGQLEDERAPSSKTVPVIMRANDILMDRVRDNGYYDLYQSERGDKLLDEHDPGLMGNALETELRPQWNVKRFAFFHLREIFDAQLPEYPNIPGPVERTTATGGHAYRLSNIRTDLDSFSDIEAYALMYDGYCLANKHVCAMLGIPPTLPPRSVPDEWQFLQITTMLQPKDAIRLKTLLRHLEVGKERFFKVFRLPDPLALAVAVIMAFLIAELAYAWRTIQFTVPTFSVTAGEIAATVIVAAIIALLHKLESTRWMAEVLDFVRSARRGRCMIVFYWALGLLLALVAITITFYLWVFDKLFLRAGKVR